MSDPIQRSSSLPVPAYQTLQGSQNPAETSSPKSIQRADDTVVEAKEETRTGNFEDYLNQQSVTTLEKTIETTVFDTASAINKDGVYQQPGVNTPV
jgi:hypothetical protein